MFVKNTPIIAAAEIQTIKNESASFLGIFMDLNI